MTTPKGTSVIRTLPFGSDAELRRRYMVMDEPIQANLRFGRILEFLDKLAEETAIACVHQVSPAARVVTAAIDNILIRHPGDVTRDMVFHARINFVGKTSMEVGIRVEHPGDPTVHVATCYFTMVAREGDGENARGVELPPLDLSDENDRHRAEKAKERREAYRRHLAAMQEPPSREEYEMLRRLHLAQEEPDFKGLLAGNLVTEGWERMYPEQENVPKTIFGGYLVRRAYELSAICAEHVAPDRPVIAAVNRINFHYPVHLDDKLHYVSRVVFTEGNTVCVEAGIERISRDRTTKALSNTCLFTFVNVDRDMVHRPVAHIYPVTYADDTRYLQAFRSHQDFLSHHYADSELLE